MASGGPVQELCEEVTCSVCLEYFKDPVTIAECGHNFCRACLARIWGALGAEASCPLCRGKAQAKDLRPNLQLADFVKIAKKFTLQDRKGAGGREGVCAKHQEPLNFFCRDDGAPLCVVCGRSKEHKDHEVTPLEEGAQGNETIIAIGKVSLCEKHQKPLKLFCKDDDAPICVACDGSMEHKCHEVIPLEEAAQEYKDQIYSSLEFLRKERKKILAYKGDVVKESQDLVKLTESEKEKLVTEYRQLRQFLEEQEKRLLTQVEEVGKEIARERDEQLARFSRKLSSLENLIWELEEKIQHPVYELLQEIRSTLQRCENKTLEDPVAFPAALKWRIWEFCDLNPFLESVMEQFKGTLLSGLQQQKVSVSLDPDTAFNYLVLSEDHKHVNWEDEAQDLPDCPERFDERAVVLGREEFTAGRHFWEVVVGREKEWAVGMTRSSVRRKGEFNIKTKEDICVVGHWEEGYEASVKPHHPPLSLKGDLKKMRVSVNCAGGRVAFFNADTAACLYTFSAGSFSGETLQPFFYVYGKGQLTFPS